MHGETPWERAFLRAMKALLIGLVAAAVLIVGGLRAFGRKLSRLLQAREGREHGRRERDVTDVVGINITAQRKEQPFLFILLSADGTINPMGNGTVDDNDHELFIGKNQGQLFEVARSKLTPELLNLCGHFERSEHLPYQLIVRFKFKHSSDAGFGFCYGSDGPSEHVRQFVVDANASERSVVSGFQRQGTEATAD
jgi:hypothetical protein